MTIDDYQQQALTTKTYGKGSNIIYPTLGLNGEAGEIVKERLGDAGMIATDLLPALPLVIKQLKEK